MDEEPRYVKTDIKLRIEPITLQGEAVRLEPLQIGHLDGLTRVGIDPEIWRWIPYAVSTPEAMRQYVEKAVAAQAAGTALPFATCIRDTGQVVGCTRFFDIDRDSRHVEIGHTWIAPDWQRTAVNTGAKYLMLSHAFEVMGCLRVQLKTDALNARSRAAILRLGAREEGILRNHVVTASGRVRNTVYFSILDSEWPQVRARLEAYLSRQGSTGA